MDIRRPLYQAIASALAGILFLNPIVATAAQLAVDAAAGGSTQIGAAGNGVPIVNIATPNGAGLSHNKFSDFNVGPQGLILNNATGKTQATQLGGIIVGNPNLKGQAAQKILNEVTGGSPSHLQGYTEVAGQGAHVIVANPNGVTCSGCGFINTPRATLATGKPILNGERLQGYDVDGGEISIDGAGLNASNIDRFELITRSAKLNADLYARQLTVVAGRNQVDAETLAATPKPDNGSAKPQLAIDSAALGGMYANTIRLVGTEAGVGVRLAGNMAASAGDIRIDANGKLELAQTAASGNLALKGQDVALNGPVYAGGSANIQAGGTLSNAQSLAASSTIALQANQLNNSGVIEAGVNPDNSRNGQGDVTLTAQGVRNAGTVLASRTLQANVGGTLDNQGGTLKGSSTALSTGSLDNRQGRLLASGQLTLAGARLDNRNGKAIGASIQLNGGALDNRLGLFSADQALTLSLDSLDNSGQGSLVSEGMLQASVSQRLDNRNGGLLAANQGVSVQGGQLLNQSGEISSKAGVAVRAASLNNSGGQLIGQGGIDLDLQGGALNNAGGLLGSPGQLRLRNVASLDNQGGEISSDRAFTLTTGTLLNQGGKLLSGERLTLTSGALDNRNAGVLSGSQGLSVNAASLDNSQGGTLASRGDLLVRSQGALDNSGNGALVAGGQLDVGSASLNNQGGLLSASGNLLLATGNADNRNGKVIAQGRLDATTANLDNRDGVLSGQQGLDLGAGNVLNGASRAGQPGGLITSQGVLSLRGGRLESTGGGEISAKGELHLSIARLIQQQAALIGEGKVRIDLGSGAQRGDFDNRGGLLSAGGALQVNGLGNLDNRGGEISGSQGFSIEASGSLDNRDQGRIISAATLSLQAEQVLNAGLGLLSGWQGLTLNGGRLDNSAGGTLSSRSGTLGITLSGALDNHDQGALVSQGKLTLAAASLNNANGILSTQGDLDLTLAGDLDNSNGGLLSTQGALTGNGKVLDNRGGQISAGSVGYDTTRFDNSGGRLVSRGALRLGLLGALLNNGAGSTIASGGPLTLGAGSVENRGGQLASQGLLKVLAGGFDNSGGSVAAQDNLSFGLGGELLNGQAGLLFSQAGALDISASRIANAGGSAQGQAGATLTTSGAIDNQGGRIGSQAGNLDLQAASLDNGNGGIIDAAKGVLTLVTGWFGNHAGTTQAQALDVQASDGIDNRDGHLSAVSGDNRIVTGDLNNQGGGLYAGGLLSLRGKQLLNDGAALGQGGKIGAGAIDFSLTGALNNRFGLIESSNTLNLGAASIDNVVGAIRALGQVGSTQVSTSGLLNNNLGRLESAAENLSLQTGSLQNGGGSVLHVGSGTFGLDLAQAGLAGGSFTSNGSLSYQTASWTNNAVIQARNLTLDIGQLSQGSGGQLLASQTFSGSGGDWSNDGLIASDGRLDLHLRGGYSGDGRVSSLKSLALTAASVDLGTTASLAGGADTRVTASGSLNNSGRLTSAADLKLSAASLNNDGTLGSAGALRIEAANLLNQNGLIVSGGDMALRVGSFVNRYADVYSLGALDIAADDAGNRAARLDNLSASLESQGDMRLNVSALNNARVVLQVDAAGKYTAKIVEVNCYKYFNDENADCSGGKENQVWEITERDKLSVSNASAAASISAGGNLSINAEQLNNASSQIAAGQNLYARVDSLSNQGVVTGESETLRVYRSERTRDPETRRDEADAFTERYWLDSQSYVNDPSGLAAALSHFIARTEREYPQYGSASQLVQDSQTYAGIIQAAGNVAIDATSQINNSVIRNHTTYVNPGQQTANTAVGASPVSTVVPINAQLPPSLAQQQINPLTLPGFSLPTGSNGLFRLSGQGVSAPGAGQRQQALDVGNRQTDGVSAPVASAAVSGPSSGALNVARVQGLPSSAVPDN
ncbi:filamentous hemagglutinin N-terminal domain-containing protein, partial [Pseudomonas panipatensis]|uniref:two-partner secretion domain-containing protein n=1 Tax=Pseudomonas panipatensis TaxID=428992 RepID=UPI00240309D8